MSARIFSRRLAITGLAGITAGLLARPSNAQLATNPEVTFKLPLDRSNKPTALYFSRTGHNLSGSFLNHWVQYGRADTFGLPVTELMTENSVRKQYFENAVFKADSTSDEPTGVVTEDIGTQWFRTYGSRSLHGLFVPNESDWYPYTIEGVHPVLWTFYRDSGSVAKWGLPISWPYRRNGVIGQVFEKAHLITGTDRIQVEPIGHWFANRTLDSTDLQRKAPMVGSIDSESSIIDSDYDYGRPEDRSVDVNLTHQVATFLVGEKAVYRALIASGAKHTPTPPGIFKIFLRREVERMVGGEVGTSDYYDLSDVYYTQYFTDDWIGFHYAYWHNGFGDSISHGCVNMRIEDSRWAWEFCSNGTVVNVHY